MAALEHEVTRKLHRTGALYKAQAALVGARRAAGMRCVGFSPRAMSNEAGRRRRDSVPAAGRGGQYRGTCLGAALTAGLAMQARVGTSPRLGASRAGCCAAPCGLEWAGPSSHAGRLIRSSALPHRLAPTSPQASKGRPSAARLAQAAPARQQARIGPNRRRLSFAAAGE